MSLAVLVLASLTALPVVVVDPGHGGEQTGARGVCGVDEKDVTLAIAHEVAGVLTHSGRVSVLMTRTADIDVSLEDRALRANAAGAAVFLSIHANASPSARSRGIETFFLSQRAAERRHHDLVMRENDGRPLKEAVGASALDLVLAGLARQAAHKESQQLAIRLHERLQKRLAVRGRGVMQAPFIVLRETDMAAALVEVGFLTNRDECRRLRTVEYQREIAQAVAAGVLAHLVVRAEPAALSAR